MGWGVWCLGSPGISQYWSGQGWSWEGGGTTAAGEVWWLRKESRGWSLISDQSSLLPPPVSGGPDCLVRSQTAGGAEERPAVRASHPSLTYFPPVAVRLSCCLELSTVLYCRTTTILRATVISNVYTTESSEQWHTVKHQSSVRTDLGQSYLCSEFSFIWNKTSRRLSRHPESQHGQQWVFMSCLLFLKPRYSQTPRRGGGWLGSLIWFSG